MMVGMRLASVEGKVLEVSLRMTCPYITCSSVLHPSPCTATSTSYSTAHFKPLYSTTKQTWTPAVSSHTCRSILCPNCQLYRSTLCPNCQKCAVNSVPELSNMQVNCGGSVEYAWSTLCPNYQICRSTLCPNCQICRSTLCPNCQIYRSAPCGKCQICTINSVPELSNMYGQLCARTAKYAGQLCARTVKYAGQLRVGSVKYVPSTLCPNCQTCRWTPCPKCQICTVNSVPELSNMYGQLCARTAKYVGQLCARTVKCVGPTLSLNCQMRLFSSCWTAKYLLVHSPRTVIRFHSKLINDTVKFIFDFRLTNHFNFKPSSDNFWYSDIIIYKHSREWNIYCFSTATVVTRTRLNVTFHFIISLYNNIIHSFIAKVGICLQVIGYRKWRTSVNESLVRHILLWEFCAVPSKTVGYTVPITTQNAQFKILFQSWQTSLRFALPLTRGILA